MKNLKFVALMLVVFTALTFESCKNPCKDVNCLNGGSCDEDTGECVCTSGYEGANCGAAVNEKFAGTWTLIQTCVLYSGTDTTSIEVAAVDGTTNNITIKGLYFESQFTANATIGSDGLSFTIPQQVVTQIPTRDITGSGSISADGSTISIEYTAAMNNGAPDPSETCTGTMRK